MLCSKIGCGGHSAQAAVADRCYCNAECVAYNDCCADYDAICAHGAPPSGAAPLDDHGPSQRHLCDFFPVVRQPVEVA